MKEFFLRFRISLGFLTVIPAGIKKENISQDALAKSALFFPVVGILMGALFYLLFFLLKSFFIPQITSFLILTLWVYLTGALHIDGFADTIDGISGGKNRQEILEIMKDAHIGTKGVVAVCLLLFFKYFLIFSVLNSPRVKILIYAPAVGRYAMVLAGFVLPCAREEGMGSSFKKISLQQVIFSSFLIFALGFLILGIKFFYPLGAAFICLFFLFFYFKKKTGGFTGDVLGAICEITETLTILASS